MQNSSGVEPCLSLSSTWKRLSKSKSLSVSVSLWQWTQWIVFECEKIWHSKSKISPSYLHLHLPIPPRFPPRALPRSIFRLQDPLSSPHPHGRGLSDGASLVTRKKPSTCEARSLRSWHPHLRISATKSMRPGRQSHTRTSFLQKKTMENSKLKDMQRAPHSIPFWIKTVLLEMVLSKQSRNYCLPKASGRFASGCLDLNPWLTKTTMQQQTWNTTVPRPCSKIPTCHLSDAGSPCSWFLKSIGLADHAQADLKKKNRTNDMTSWQKKHVSRCQLACLSDLEGPGCETWATSIHVSEVEVALTLTCSAAFSAWGWRNRSQRWRSGDPALYHLVGLSPPFVYSNAVTLVFMHQNIFRNPVSTV